MGLRGSPPSGENITFQTHSTSLNISVTDVQANSLTLPNNAGTSLVTFIGRVSSKIPSVTCTLTLYDNGILVKTLNSIVGDGKTYPQHQGMIGFYEAQNNGQQILTKIKTNGGGDTSYFEMSIININK